MIRNIDFEERPESSLKLKHNILSFRVEGKLDRDSFKGLVNRLHSEFESPEHVKLYLEVTSLDGLESGIVWDSIRFGLKDLKDYLNQVDKVAVVTDSRWMAKATRLEDKVLPGIKERAFAMDEKEEAIDWLKSGR